MKNKANEERKVPAVTGFKLSDEAVNDIYGGLKITKPVPWYKRDRATLIAAAVRVECAEAKGMEILPAIKADAKH